MVGEIVHDTDLFLFVWGFYCHDVLGLVVHDLDLVVGLEGFGVHEEGELFVLESLELLEELSDDEDVVGDGVVDHFAGL